MFETLNKLGYFGLGIMDMTRERAETMFDDCVRRGQVEHAKKDVFVRDLMDAGERARTNLEEMIARQINKAVDKLNLATREDVARLEAKLDDLLATCRSGEEK